MFRAENNQLKFSAAGQYRDLRRSPCPGDAQDIAHAHPFKYIRKKAESTYITTAVMHSWHIVPTLLSTLYYLRIDKHQT